MSHVGVRGHDRVGADPAGIPGPPDVLRLLSDAWGMFGGSRLGQRLLGTTLTPTVGRAWARAAAIEPTRCLPDDVTVLIGVRNRTDERLANALRTVREQAYPHGSVEILVIDWGSDEMEARRLADLGARHSAEVLRVDGVRGWSRGRCLNVGLRRVRTRWVMTSDADILLSPHYLADAVASVRVDPLSVACSTMLDLPEASVEALRHAGRGDVPLDLDALRPRCSPRLGWARHPSIAVTLTAFHHAIRGYDEFYEGWGREDEDVIRRFRALGLRTVSVPSRSFYLHQWHPKFEGIAVEDRSRVVERNDRHFRETSSILRNDENWGRPGVVAA